MSETTPTIHLPYPDEGDTADVPRDIQALALALDPLGYVPVGAVLMWPAMAAPAGWLLMQGQAVPAATYPGLATLLGQAGGNVTIPDMTDLFPVGVGVNAVNATGGAASVALTNGQMPVHSHGGTTGARDRAQTHNHSLQNSTWVAAGAQFGNPGAPWGVTGGSGGNTMDADTPDHKHTISSDGGGQAHENRPPFRALNFIIRAG